MNSHWITDTGITYTLIDFNFFGIDLSGNPGSLGFDRTDYRKASGRRNHLEYDRIVADTDYSRRKLISDI